MIEVSTQATVSQGADGALAGTVRGDASGSTGASGFLRLFEILLGGMPQGGRIGSLDALDAGAQAGTADPSADGAAAAQTALAGIVAPSDGADPIQVPGSADAGIGSDDAGTIAELLRGLGFSVDAGQIASLGELDRGQLASAMEFLERGVQAGLPGDALLENAACLMPREWNFDGGVAASAPRVGGLASTGDEDSGIDPAQIAAGAEAVRQILASVAGFSASAEATSEASAKPALGGVDPEGAAPESVPDVPSAAARIHAAGATDPRRGIVLQGGTRAGASDDERASGASERKVAVASSSRPHAGSAAAATAVGLGVQDRAAQSSEATDSSFASALAAKTETETVRQVSTVAHGVRAGSMASEFIGRQVLEKVDVQLKQGRRELNVRLWPEELGEVRLSLRMGEADKLDARIMVQTESVRQAILDATPQLREALARHGMEMGRLSVNIDSGSASGGDLASDGGSRGREGGDERRQGRGWRDEEVGYEAPLALGVDSGYRDGRNTLDMWS